MHNKVNAHLGYKEISLPKALESYRDEYKSMEVFSRLSKLLSLFRITKLPSGLISFKILKVGSDIVNSTSSPQTVGLNHKAAEISDFAFAPPVREVGNVPDLIV